MTLLEAAVDHIYPPPFGFLHNLPVAYTKIVERQEMHVARLGYLPVLEEGRIVGATAHDRDDRVLHARGRRGLEGRAEHLIVGVDVARLVGKEHLSHYCGPGLPDGHRVGDTTRHPHVVL